MTEQKQVDITQAPWIWCDLGHGPILVQELDGEERQVVLTTIGVRSTMGAETAEIATYSKDDRVDAINPESPVGRLLAATPDLAAALARLSAVVEKFFEGESDMLPEREAALAALAKAGVRS